ncbi:MAG: HNH endonuclease [Lachnospiraceae bacterium]|nr:HNH endonuclease [Lachnospiraceae bacterium]
MKVNVISRTVQQFNGESFYLCGNYFQRKGRRLHRAVWEYHNGSIPKGYHVHHIDEDRANNQPENLKLMEGAEHLSAHMNEPNRKEESRKSIKKAIAAAPKWHKSKEGIKWHSERGKKNWIGRKPYRVCCAWCGKEFETIDMARNRDHFCHPNHKAAALRWRRKHDNQKNYPGRAY